MQTHSRHSDFPKKHGPMMSTHLARCAIVCIPLARSHFNSLKSCTKETRQFTGALNPVLDALWTSEYRGMWMYHRLAVVQLAEICIELGMAGKGRRSIEGCLPQVRNLGLNWLRELTLSSFSMAMTWRSALTLATLSPGALWRNRGRKTIREVCVPAAFSEGGLMLPNSSAIAKSSSTGSRGSCPIPSGSRQRLCEDSNVSETARSAVHTLCGVP